ncbi:MULTISPECIES: hypothetical protein [Streptomyces]|uniref:hypothetical protein n=1 Tax=Streptomyces TaxID=1883 RepID=UPI001D170EBB|nr:MULTISPECIES: hypothetical protein [Streptomyces]MCX5036852.1 hypothetical protein [Streptomyces coelicoflavus]
MRAAKCAARGKTLLDRQAVWEMGTALQTTVTRTFAVGLALGAMPTVVEAGDPSRSGVATALYNNVKTLGGAVAGGVFASVLGSLLTADGEAPGERAYVVLWLVAGGCALAAAGAITLAHREEGEGAVSGTAPVVPGAP